MIQTGCYVLKKTIKNEFVDRRTNHWYARPEWEKGTLLYILNSADAGAVYTVYNINSKKMYNLVLHMEMAGNHPAEKESKKTSAMVARLEEAIEPLEETPEIYLRRIYFDDYTSADDLMSALLDMGKVTLADLKDAHARTVGRRREPA